MSISSRINEMSSHIEQAYDELQGLGADLTNVNKNIENISMVLDDIYDSMPSVSGEGTSLTLDDTRVGKIKSTLKGNTSQETTTGKNKASDVWEEYIQSTGTANYRLYPLTLEQGKTYMLSGVLVGTQKTSYYNFGIVKNGDNYNNFVDPHFAVDYNTGNGQQYTFTVDNSFISPKLICYVTSKSVFEELFTNYNIQLEEGSSRTSFEPYTNGASPNPSYPQPVHVVSGDNEINVCGKNLLNIANWVKGRINNTTGNIEYASNVSSMTIEENDIKFIVSQAWNSGIASDFIPISTGTYTFTFSHNREISVYIDTYKNQNERLSRVLSYTDSASPTTRTFTISDSNVKYIRIHFEVNTVNVEYIVSDMQLEKGSATTYEPYQGNTYNIDLPVENLFDSENNVVASHNGITNTYNSNGSVTLSGQASSSYANVFNDVNGVLKKDETYTFSTIGTKSFAIGFRVYYTDNTYGDFNLSASATSIQIIPTKEVSKFRIYIFSMTSGTTYNSTLFFQLEKGTNYNTFTPYGTTPIELCKIGTYRDYFYKDSGKLYLHKEIGKVVLNGSENIAREPIQNNHYKFYLQNISNVDYGDINYIPKILCDKLIAIGRTTMYVNTQGISSSNGALQIYTDDTKDMTISEFRTWLGSNNFIVYYGLITPTTTEITYQPLIDQLNLLEKAMSKDGQTNISQVNNDLPFIISASALKEWQENTSLNSTLSMVNPLSLGNTLNTQEIENNTQPIEVDNIEPLEEEENEES